MIRVIALVTLLLSVQIVLTTECHSRPESLERVILERLALEGTATGKGNCDRKEGYSLYLIDNFDEKIEIVPEIGLTHGELVLSILNSGRNDFAVTNLNTSLNKGLAKVLFGVIEGECVDAVVSSIPGSNYSYSQIASLFQHRPSLDADNIVEYRTELLHLMRDIAFNGFPSVEWLQKIEVNPIKLREDAQKIVFIEALGGMEIPVFLPYGNDDTTHKGESRMINLLSLPTSSHVYSGVDKEGNRLAGYPYSPLSTGDATAVYSIIECPDGGNVRFVNLDINEDNRTDFHVQRVGAVPYYDDRSEISYAPRPIGRSTIFEALNQKGGVDQTFFDEEMVLTAEEYRKLLEKCSDCSKQPPLDQQFQALVWINSLRHGPFFTFNPQCQDRGYISGTSLIPPVIVKEYLPTLNSSN